MLTRSMLSSLRSAGKLIKISDLGLQVITCRMHHVRNIVILTSLQYIRKRIPYRHKSNSFQQLIKINQLRFRVFNMAKSRFQPSNFYLRV
jgi:hypothetical protein